MEKINGDNLCIGGTFTDFMKSIKKELERIIDKNVSEYPVTIILENCDSFIRDEGINESAMSIAIAGDSHIVTSFSIAKFEFDRQKEDRKGLQNLVRVRFIDCIYYIEIQREILFKVLKQFDPEWETPDDYEH